MDFSNGFSGIRSENWAKYERRETMRHAQLVLALAITLLLLTACRPVQAPAAEAPATPAPPPVASIFIIGNGFLDGTCCVDKDLAGLIASATPEKEVATKQTAVWDATLQTHYRYLPYQAPAEVARGGHDVVVLQDDIPTYSEKNTDIFREIVPLFDADIRNAGGRTVLLMAPAYPDVSTLNWVTLDEIVEAHRAAGEELNIPVAPVALAMQRAETARPELAMLGGGGATMVMVDADSVLPSAAGTYLAAAVLYATIFGEDPSELAYHPDGLSVEDAAFLRQVAWESVQAWNSAE
jgi:hypothetical protein